MVLPQLRSCVAALLVLTRFPRRIVYHACPVRVAMLGGSSGPLAVQIWDHMNEILANLHDLDFRKCGCPPSLPVPCARARTVPRGARRRCPVAPFLRRRFRCGPTLRTALYTRCSHARNTGAGWASKITAKPTASMRRARLRAARARRCAERTAVAAVSCPRPSCGLLVARGVAWRGWMRACR